MKRPLAIVLCFLLCSGCSSLELGAAEAPDAYRVYIGTYTRGKSEGIYHMRLDMKTGELSAPKLAAKVANPSFLELHPDGAHLYAVNEVAKFKELKSGGVGAFKIDAKTGDLTLINQQPSKGTGPCHVSLNPKGTHVFVANYGGGSVAALPIGDDGGLGEASGFVQHAGSSVHPTRQKGPHGHSINPDPAGRYVFAADLGLDQVLVYRFDAAKGALTPNDPPYAKVDPGSGPRHFAFHPSGKFAYVINEMTLTVTAFSYDAAAGKLTAVQTLSTLPADVTNKKGMSTAEVRVHPSGKFLYGSNRGHDSIAIFAIDQSTGKLTHVGNEPTQGKTPRNFNLDPTGTFLLAANQNSDTVVVFRIDIKTGKLTPTGQKVEVPTPVCVRFLPIK